MAQPKNCNAYHTESIVFEIIVDQENFYWSKIGVGSNNEFKIMVRKTDNFINISKFILEHAPTVRFAHWQRNGNVKEFLKALQTQCLVFFL